MRLTRDARAVLGACAVLLVGTAIGYWHLPANGFVSFDDAIYLTDNVHIAKGFTWEGVVWAFETGYGGNWHPITWLSHMLDVQLFGFRPGYHHLVSLGLHITNAGLVLLLFWRMTGAFWRSSVVAALFAWHPLHVESVAWAAERKDVLSGFFFLLTLLFYREYGVRDDSIATADEQNQQAKDKKTGRLFYYFAALGLYGLGLMSKPMLVTTPFVMLLLDGWPLGRLGTREGGSRSSRFRKLLGEKLPFFGLTVGACVATVLAQKGAGAVVSMEAMPFSERFLNALVAWVGYLRKTFWPSDLAIIYPLHAKVSIGLAALSGIFIVAISLWVLWRLKQKAYLAVGWFWYLGMLVPVIGLVQVGMQQMADRYTYLPLLGIFMILVWEGAELVERWRVPKAVWRVTTGAVLLVCLGLTNLQASYWRESESLFGHAVAVTKNNYVALNNYADALLKKGKVEEAIRNYEAAIQLAPEVDAARCGLGEALERQGKYEAAEKELKAVLDLDPRHARARLEMGLVRAKQGRLEEAVKLFSELLRDNPADSGAHNNLGNVLQLEGKQEEAIEHFYAAVRLGPGQASPHNNLGIALQRAARAKAAISEYRAALRLQPELVEAMNNLAFMLAATPDASLRNGQEALKLASRACELTGYRHPLPLTTLAAAYAETGQFEEALRIAEQVEQMPTVGQGQLRERLEVMLNSYRQSKPVYMQ
jgi:tetratricopeptide (TPR) repeat protein